jgi:hypothetical protein
VSHLIAANADKIHGRPSQRFCGECETRPLLKQADYHLVEAIYPVARLPFVLRAIQANRWLPDFDCALYIPETRAMIRPHKAATKLPIATKAPMPSTSASGYRRSKNVFVFLLFIPELELGHVERHVLAGHLVEGADHAALKDRPEGLWGEGATPQRGALARNADYFGRSLIFGFRHNLAQQHQWLARHFFIKFRLGGDGSRESVFASLAALTQPPTTTNLID